MKHREWGGGTPSRGEDGVPPSDGSDRPNVPPGRELGGVLLLIPGEVEEPPPWLLSREPLAGWDGGPRRGLGGGAGPDRRRPCSRRRRMLQVAKDSDEEEERLSESLVVSFFCLVRRFWNHTLTWTTQPGKQIHIIILVPCANFEKREKSYQSLKTTTRHFILCISTRQIFCQQLFTLTILHSHSTHNIHAWVCAARAEVVLPLLCHITRHRYNYHKCTYDWNKSFMDGNVTQDSTEKYWHLPVSKCIKWTFRLKV